MCCVARFGIAHNPRPRYTAGTMQARTLTLSQAAQYLGIAKRSFYRMIGDGRFDVPSIPDIRPRRWNVEDLDAWRGRGE
jgi:excisionase family DNA binding protein